MSAKSPRPAFAVARRHAKSNVLSRLAEVWASMALQLQSEPVAVIERALKPRTSSRPRTSKPASALGFLRADTASAGRRTSRFATSRRRTSATNRRTKARCTRSGRGLWSQNGHRPEARMPYVKKRRAKSPHLLRNLVDGGGIEPPTSALRTQRSPS